MNIVVIKGAGDIASGIAYRLKKCGCKVVMTEIAIPTTVRRTVAFSRAVYEGSCTIEGITAEVCKGLDDVLDCLRRDNIPVVVDEDAKIIDVLKPEVVVDAILAKRNINTAINQAPMVIGVGPGFTAGDDCHYVIETKRGHYLGRVIEKGSAIPNTGVPGEIGGFSAERIIRAEAEGFFRPLKEIGDRVEKGSVVAESGGAEIRARMTGIIRGMLQEGVAVVPGMKCGDIDARCEPEYCHQISDKALAISGGVLEAVLRGTEWRKCFAGSI